MTAWLVAAGFALMGGAALVRPRLLARYVGQHMLQHAQVELASGE